MPLKQIIIRSIMLKEKTSYYITYRAFHYKINLIIKDRYSEKSDKYCTMIKSMSNIITEENQRINGSSCQHQGSTEMALTTIHAKEDKSVGENEA